MTKTRRAEATVLNGECLDAHRRRIVRALLGICRSIERLQESEAARRACREVAARLETLTTETDAGGGNRN